MKKLIFIVVFSILLFQSTYCQIPIGSSFSVIATIDDLEINNVPDFDWNCEEDGDFSIVSAGMSVFSSSNLELAEDYHIIAVDDHLSVDLISIELRTPGAFVNTSNTQNLGMSITGLIYKNFASCSFYVEIGGINTPSFKSKSFDCNYDEKSESISVESNFKATNLVRSFSFVISVIRNDKPFDTEAITDGEKVAIAALVPILFFLCLIAIYFGRIRKMRKERKTENAISMQYITDSLQTKVNKLERENSVLKDLDKIDSPKAINEDLESSDSSIIDSE